MMHVACEVPFDVRKVMANAIEMRCGVFGHLFYKNTKLKLNDDGKKTEKSENKLGKKNEHFVNLKLFKVIETNRARR